ncbi:MAG: hypothetical protein ACI97A_003347, partial [Planctomycetota bacterium]
MRKRWGVSACFMGRESKVKVVRRQGFTGRLTFCTVRANHTEIENYAEADAALARAYTMLVELQ